MDPAILSLGTTVPSHYFKQNEIFDLYQEIFSLSSEKKGFAKNIFEQSSIKKRHSVISDFEHARDKWNFWGADYPNSIPGMSKRNELYKQTAPKLALDASRKALKNWGGKNEEITHLISISCTGVMTPGIEFILMQELNLNPTINRLGINFMGCFGAFKGLSTARSFALENPKNRILVVCTELCSLHMQADQSHDTIVANSLFADGAAAAIVGTGPQKNENPLWTMVKTTSMGLANSLDKMSWEASDYGFLMGLSHIVPVLILRNIGLFIEHTLQNNIDPLQCNWAIHPGGKSIIQAVERGIKLKKEHTLSTWEILSQYGNMSSATYLFVLDHLSQQLATFDWTIGIAFGPGLSIEGMLLKRPEASSCT